MHSLGPARGHKEGSAGFSALGALFGKFPAGKWLDKCTRPENKGVEPILCLNSHKQV